MNKTTLQQLDYNRILNTAASFAHTERAKRTILASEPKTVKKQIAHMLEEVREAVRILEISSSIPLHAIDEITTYIEQAKKGLFLQPAQLQRVLSFLEHCRKLKTFMKDKVSVAPNVANYVHAIGDLRDVEEEIGRCLRNGRIDDHASPELADLRRHLRIRQTEVKEKAEAMCSSKKLSAYLQDPMVVEKNGRYTIPVKKQYRSKVNGTIVDTSASGATVFMEPREVAMLYEELQILAAEEQQEVERILYTLTALVHEKEQDLNVAMETVHHYDVIFAKAKYGRSIDGIVPDLNEDFRIHLDEARHPLLGEQAVPLTLPFGNGDRTLIITGPNTGGKTVTLKTAGLLTLMAQTGLLVPAGKSTSLHVFRHVFVDIGDGQSIEQNLSTFSSRMTNIIRILEEADANSLVLVDELGSGTDPNEGMALAQVIIEQLFAKGTITLATTHYRELKAMADQTEGIMNGSMAFNVETLQPTYRLVLGETGNSQAFEIAYKLGLHPQLITRAHKLSGSPAEPIGIPANLPQAKKRKYERQLSIDKYTDQRRQKKKQTAIPQFSQGDNVTVSPDRSVGIVYKGPDETGHYIVQIKGEKQRINHKRLKLHIPASELYPPDYDFDIIFKSVEYRKTKRVVERKYEEGLILREEE
ncbi:DNA mismatch repair protein [Alteribacter lacisalsi]|uniref:DNA mismatch repair protein n=1 Tax=Alteribacter lacisalsi TaxID=2045244 RepID=A0A2W0H4J2_9BACI|nr:endonuclease MutS2 [Alteribacter lacisalsi]PYZ96753.1 DNA mismatch repair protein [Alteribacter lacisalsi]